MIKSMFTNRDLRNKLLVLLVGLGLYKMGVHITVPGIDREILKEVGDSGGVLTMMDTFTGGSVSNFSIFAIGIMPYITASIIMQLLQMDGIKIITEWGEQGAVGKAKITRLTYILTLVFALLQAFAMAIGFGNMYEGLLTNDTVWGIILITLVLTMGTVILVVIGEVIEEKGIGRGISMIILGGILMSLPTTFLQLFEMKYEGGSEIFISLVTIGLIVLMMAVLVGVVIYIEGAARRIPTHKSAGGKHGKLSQTKSYLPMKLNVAGVIPVIFASAFFMVPGTIGEFIDNDKINLFINTFLSYDTYMGVLIYALLIMGFTFFYAFVQMDPEKIALNLSGSGSYVPSIRPGTQTEEYITRVLLRVTIVGSIFLAMVATVPMLIGKFISLPEGLIFGGTSIIIIVSVGIDFITQLTTYTQSSRYSKLLKNKRKY